MITAFCDYNGKVLFTYPNIEIHKDDYVKFNSEVYIVIKRTFDVKGGYFEVVMRNVTRCL